MALLNWGIKHNITRVRLLSQAPDNAQQLSVALVARYEKHKMKFFSFKREEWNHILPRKFFSSKFYTKRAALNEYVQL